MPESIANLNLNKNEIKNVVVHKSATAPSNPKQGQIYFNTTDNNLYRYNGTSWVTYQAPLSTVNASTIGVDNTPTSDSSNLVTSGGVYSALQDVDALPSQTGNDGKFLKTDGTDASWDSAPVTSVNNKTGVVSLTASDVNALPDSTTIPTASTTTPLMDGTASYGSGTSYARSNHVHPTDTTRQAKITASGILKGDGSGGVTAATGGTDYARMSDIPSVPGGSSTSPKMDGTATVGTETTWAHGDHIHPTDTSRAPTSHASTATTYGIGTSSNYGHVKLSDSTSSTSSTSSGIAATPAAVKAVMDAIPSVPSPADANPLMDGTAAVGSSTDYAREDHVHPSDTSKINTSAIGAANGVAPLNASSQIDPSYLPSYVDDVVEGYYNSTDGKFYEEDTYTTEITPEAGKIYIDLSTNKSYRWGGSTYVEMPTGSTVTVSPTLTSGEEVGTITIDGTTTTLYAPEDTDTKVNQTKVTYSSYTYWRAIPFGTYNASTPTGALSATNTTDREYTVDNLRFWPQYGWIRTHAFNPAPTAANTTASYNSMTSDSINNIYFRINATAYNNGDTVMTLYSNGTDMQVRPGGQYDNMVDLGKPTVRWRDLYLSGEAYINHYDGLNTEVPLTYSSNTWSTTATYEVMDASRTKGGIVYFNYNGHTAIATYASSTFTATITYIDSGTLYQKTFSIDSTDELTVSETSYTFPTIYNGATS